MRSLLGPERNADYMCILLLLPIPASVYFQVHMLHAPMIRYVQVGSHGQHLDSLSALKPTAVGSLPKCFCFL